MTGLLVAVTFLTRIPVPERARADADIARSIPWFPVVGAGVGLLTAGICLVLAGLVPAYISSFIAVAAATYLTGAFHEDGLADTADAFGGSFDRDEALRIMKDPSHGSYGVLALVLSVGIRVAAIAALPPLTVLAVLPAAHALSRGFALQLLRLPPVGAAGLGTSFSERASGGRLAVTVAVSAGLALAFSGPATIVFALACLPGVAYVGRLAVRKIGGITGDVLGAAQQVAELSVLVVAYPLAFTFLDPVWWA